MEHPNANIIPGKEIFENKCSLKFIFVISRLRNIVIHKATVIKFKTLLCSGAIFLHIEISRIVYRIIKQNQTSIHRIPFPIDIPLLI